MLKHFFKQIVLAILVAVTTLCWSDVWVFKDTQLWIDIPLTIDVVCLMLLMAIRHKHKLKTPIKRMFDTLILLDNENDVNILRNVRLISNRKLQRSVVNKCMIKATKEICGKECKCQELKKRKSCDMCETYKGYVNYLRDFYTE